MGIFRMTRTRTRQPMGQLFPGQWVPTGVRIWRKFGVGRLVLGPVM